MSCKSTLTWPDQADISGCGEKTLWSTRWKPGERKVWHLDLALACSSERMLNRGRCITGVMWKWNFVRSWWCCCLRRGGGLDAETKRSSSTNWHPMLSWIHSQTASLLELDDNPHLTTSTQHVMVGITRSKVIYIFFLARRSKRLETHGITSKDWKWWASHDTLSPVNWVGLNDDRMVTFICP